MVADLFAATLAAPLDFGDADAVEVEISHLRQNREVVYASVWQAEQPTPVKTFGADPSAESSGPAAEETSVVDDRVVARRVVRGHEGKTVGRAVVHFSLAREHAAYEATRERLLLLCVALAGGTLALLTGLARRQVLRPIAKLLAATRRVERGEENVRVEVGSYDEVGRLARAFNAMNEAIADRERRLARANHDLRELFDHMRQAIVAFGPDGAIAATFSHQASMLFGDGALEGRHVKDLLYADAPWAAEGRAFDEWLPLAFEVDPDRFGEVAELAPREVVIGASSSNERVLSLDFQPIALEGKVARIMLLCTDETEKRRLERQFEEREEHYGQKLASMKRFVGGGGRHFAAFLESARTRLARCRELFGPTAGSMLSAEIAEAFQHVHTVKGEARAFDLGELANVMRGLEERLADVRGEARDKGSASAETIHADVVVALSAAAEALDRAERLFVEASPVGRAALDQITVDRVLLQRLAELSRGRSDEIATIAETLAARPFGETSSHLVDKVPAWAEGDGKRARLEVEDRERPVPPALASVLGGALVHLVRNAIAHGIETPEKREAAGKSPIGLVRLIIDDPNEASKPARARSPVIVVEDDGAGVLEGTTLAALCDRDEPVDASYGADGDGSSSATSNDLAGLGVGLGAAAASLSAVGYAIFVASQRGRGTRFTIRPKTARSR